jgi:energy-coupling factor transporter ATP-binding protein EcfA2
MKPIQELHINYFKFFADNAPIKIGGNHVLLYGENGSGKSSIYWALYTLLEAVYKSQDELNKYFDSENDDNLLNHHIPKEANAFVSLALANGTSYRIALNDTSIYALNHAQASLRGSDFMNYRFMFKISDFRHRDEINLFELFEKEVFPYIKTRNTFQLVHQQGTSNDFNEIWDDLKRGREYKFNKENPFDLVSFAGENERLTKDFASKLRTFVNEINTLLQDINILGNDILQNDLGYSKIRFQVDCIQKFEVLGGSGELSGKESDTPVGFPKISLKIPYYDGLAVSRPQSFLNEAKLTAIGIAIRFAILARRADFADEADFQLLVLDDLLISLDMANRDVVLDLLLNKYAQNYQLFILTHDAQFAQLVQHKIKAKGQSGEWINYEMYEDQTSEISKPYITQHKRYIERAKTHYNQLDYEAAGNYLRKETERFCKDFLPRRRQLGKDFEEKDLNGLILACIEYAKQNKLAIEPFQALDQHRKFIFNVLSHDSYDVPRFRTELKKAFQTFEKLDKLRFRTILETENKLSFEMHDGNNLWKAVITIYEPLVLIEEEGKEGILGKIFANYQLFQDGQKHQSVCHEYVSIKDFYEKWWNKSDKKRNIDFWEEVTIGTTQKKLKELKPKSKMLEQILGIRYDDIALF